MMTLLATEVIEIEEDRARTAPNTLLIATVCATVLEKLLMLVTRRAAPEVMKTVAATVLPLRAF